MAPKQADDALALLRAEIAAQRDETKKLFELQASKQDAMIDTIRGAISQIQADRADDMKKIEARIAQTDEAWQKAIQAIRAELGSSGSTASSGTADSFLQRKRRMVGSTAASTAASTTNDNVRDVTRVWLVNFPKPMPATKLEKIAKSNVDKHVPSHEASLVKVQALNFKQRVSITFTTAENARNFLNSYAARPDEYAGTDGVVSTIHAKPDRSYDSRTIGKANGILWKRVHAALTESKKMEPRFQLGTTGIKGQLYIQDEDNIWELFTTTVNASRITITPNDTNLKLWGIQDAMMNDMMREANEAAAERLSASEW
jgi:hypothetical protein